MSQKEGEKDQGEVTQIGGDPPSCFKVSWSFWLSFWLLWPP